MMFARSVEKDVPRFYALSRENACFVFCLDRVNAKGNKARNVRMARRMKNLEAAAEENTVGITMA